MASRLFRKFRRPRVASQPLGPWTQGVNERAEPHLLDFSELSDAANVMVDEDTGRTIKRPGTVHRADIPFLIDTPVRAHRLIKRDGQEILLVTDNKKIVQTNDLQNWTDLTPAAFLTGGAFTAGNFFIDFITAEDKVWITNGSDPVFSWDGLAASLVAYDKGTAEIELNVNGTLTSQTEFLSAELDRAGDGTTWVGQLVVCTFSANPSNIGITRPVLTFVDATDSITFDTFPATIANGDKFKVGVAIPRGRHGAFHHDTLFIAATATNPSEVRFSGDVDPNEPAILLTADNPNSWSALDQFEVGASEGDRIRGFTNPVYRDRIAVYKSTGIYRIEPSASFKFRPITLTEQFGSRFPKSWQQHGEVLMFLGQDKDGLPDVFMTDFTTVRHFNRKHKDTLDNFKQPDSLQQNRIITSQADFDIGVKSSLVDSIGSVITTRVADTEAEYTAILDSGNNVDIETSPGEAHVQGYCTWDTAYDGDSNANTFGFNRELLIFPSGFGDWKEASAGGRWRINLDRTAFGNSSTWQHSLKYFEPLGAGADGKDIFVRTSMGWDGYPDGIGADSANAIFMFCRISNGAKKSEVLLTKTKLFVNSTLVQSGQNFNELNDFAILLTSEGITKVWRNGVLIDTRNASNDSRNQVAFGMVLERISSSSFDPVGHVATFDYVNFHEDYQGNKLSTQSGKVSPTTLADTLPTSGDITFKSDYKKDIHDNPTLHTLGKYHVDTDVTTGAAAFETQTSNDDASYDASVPFTNGSLPTSNVRQFLRLKTSLSGAGSDAGPFIKGFQGGALYLTPPISVGNNIAAWDIFQLVDQTLPPNLTLKARISVNTTVPDSINETGWRIDISGALGNATDNEGWLDISNTNNIGFTFGGDEDAPNPPSPNARWIQYKLEFSVDAFAAAHGFDTITTNWVDNSPEILPTQTVIWKKKWLLIGATSDSTNNNVMVIVDKNRAFMNWTGLDTNFFVWFRGKLYVGSSSRKELLELTDDIFIDDDGPDAFSGRLTTTISAFIETKQEIGGAIHQRKKARFLEVAADDETNDIAISYKRDIDPAFIPLKTVNMTPTKTHQRVHFPMGVQFKRIVIRAENNLANQTFGLEGFVFTFESVPSRSGL